MFANGSPLAVFQSAEQEAVSVLRANTPVISTEPKPPVLIHTPTIPSSLGAPPAPVAPKGINATDTLTTFDPTGPAVPLSLNGSSTEHVAENTPPPPSTTTTTETVTETQTVDYTVPIVVGGIVLVIVALLFLKHRSKGHDGPIPGV